MQETAKLEQGSALEGLRDHSVVVADTGEFEAIRRFRPTDATTNPTLVLAAARQPAYENLVADAVAYGCRASGDRAAAAVDRLMTLFGREIVAVVPRYVSTEVDARLSFDTAATVARARHLLALYDELGVERERILIKIASTWEGIRAACVLEAEGIRCNLTLMFSPVQAAAACEAGAALISPFVGRISDWYKARDGVEGYAPEEDPGVESVRHIHAYVKAYGFPTQVMAASFRTRDQVLALAGCDLLTISPMLLDELAALAGPVTRELPGSAPPPPRLKLDESGFRRRLNDDAMATEKLAEGIRRFTADQEALEALLAARLG